jgi:hypothetical protein
MFKGLFCKFRFNLCVSQGLLHLNAGQAPLVARLFLLRRFLWVRVDDLVLEFISIGPYLLLDLVLQHVLNLRFLSRKVSHQEISAVKLFFLLVELSKPSSFMHELVFVLSIYLLGQLFACVVMVTVFREDLGELTPVDFFLTEFRHSFNLRVHCHHGVVFLNQLV